MCTANLARLVTLAHRRSLAAQHRVVRLVDELSGLASQRSRLARYALDYRLSASCTDVQTGTGTLRSLHAMAGGLDEQLARVDAKLTEKRAALEAAREEQRAERGSERALVVLLERAHAKERRARARSEGEAFDASCALRLRAEHGRVIAARRGLHEGVDGVAPPRVAAFARADSVDDDATAASERASERLAA